MGRFYKRIQALDGKTLRTLKRGKPFKVKVTKDLVFVVPLYGTKRRRIDIARTETIAAKGYGRDELRQGVFEVLGPNWNASYIAAIVHEITKSPNS